MNGYLIRVQKKIKNYMRITGNIIKYVVCLVLPQGKKQITWVICERGTEARDNGYAFYRYMIEKHPEISVYYLITSDSPDYDKVSDHAVKYGSWKNYRLVAKADQIISTHCYTALPGITEKVWRWLKLEKRFCFLQHGVTQAKLPFLFGQRTGMQLFCCAAVPEFAYVKQHFQHPEGVVQCTGLARYDHLFPFEAKRQILVMPTWRRYLKDEQSFTSSTYFQAWNSLLRDKKLLDFLQITDTKLVFYPHYELQPYLKCFVNKHPNIVLADLKHYDVQQLLKDSCLLVTDYSSVFFDFAYMKKPSVFFQFDHEQFYGQHYKEGYFDFERDGFGKVLSTSEMVIDQIIELAERKYVMAEKYSSRVNDFFAYHDQNNCERIYQAIWKLSKRQ